MKQSTQNYLKAIFSISLSDNKPLVKVSELSKKLNISPAAVTDMIRKLEKEKFVVNIPYRGIRLTKKGKQVGRNMVRHHRLWEAYLYQELGLDWDQVHDEAERLEHACSDELINKIEEKLSFPAFDPHGNPIPDRHGNISTLPEQVALSECAIGDVCEIIRMVDLDTHFLKHINRLGVQLHDRLTVKDFIAFDGTFSCDVNGMPITFSTRAAQHIFVRKLDIIKSDSQSL